MKRSTNAFTELINDRLRQMGKTARQACRDAHADMDLIARAKTNLSQGKSSKLEDKTLADIAAVLNINIEPLMHAVAETTGRPVADIYPAYFAVPVADDRRQIAALDELRTTMIIQDPTPDDHEAMAVFKQALESSDPALRRAAAQLVRTMMATWPAKDR